MNHHAIRFVTIAACLALWPQVSQARPARHFRTIKAHNNFVIQFAPAANAKVVGSVSQDGTARLLKMPGRHKLVRIKGADDETFGAMAVSPDAKHVALSVDSTVRLYAIKKRKAVKLHDLKGHKKEITALAFDKAGTTLASCADGVRIWNLAGKELTVIAKDKKVSDVQFSPTSGEIVAVLEDGVHFYGRSSFKEARKIAKKKLQRVTFSPDGKLLAAVGTNGTLTVMTVAGKTVWIKEQLASETFAVFAAKGKLVLSAFRGDKVIAHSTKTGALKWFVNGKEGISVLTIKGNVLVTSGGEGRVWLWKL